MIRFSPWRFFFSYIFYGVVSIILFSITSDGWTVLFPGYGGLLFLLLTSPYLFVWTFLHRSKKSISISRTLIYKVLIIQFFALLFNYGDCQNTFIERLIGLKANSSYAGNIYGCPPGGEAKSLLSVDGAIYTSITLSLIYITSVIALILHTTTKIQSFITLILISLALAGIFSLIFIYFLNVVR